MSYRTFKRVLGETSLERKCRWWFGISLAVLLSLSFTWYGQRTDELVDERVHNLGQDAVRAGWHELHLAKLAEIEPDSSRVTESDKRFYQEVAESSRALGRNFKWDAILPSLSPEDGLPPEYYPRDEQERELLESWANRPVDQALAEAPRLEWERRNKIDGRRVYQYYQPMYCGKSCVGCHKWLGRRPRPRLQEGDLMAVVRVTIDDQDTVNAQAKNRALLWTAAVVIGFLSMISLWAVVRYVIVKPVAHLRDVANAVRQGNTDQRAEIRTGDEFEELAAAFNRMLRQLLSQQSELTKARDELNTRLDELAQANMQLYEMNRLKSDFLATVSHELRTPLNSIIGFSDVLSTIETLEEKQQRYVGNIRRSGIVLLEMINDILDLAKVESGKMEVRLSEFKIDVVIAAQCDMARPLTERKNIDLDCGAAPGLPPMRQDQSKVQQILNNLLSNAIKFTPEGGRISVRAERDVHGDLRLTVADTGIGISETEQTLVFEKFRQGSSGQSDGDTMTREHTGTGLGLSIVRELCRLLGGEVTLKSALGKGSTFTVHLPWTLESPPQFDRQMQQDLELLTRQSRAELVATKG